MVGGADSSGRPTTAPTPSPGNNDSPTSETNASEERKRPNNSNNTVQLSNPRNYEGSIPEIGAILALKFEKFGKKVPFQIFIEKVSTYTYANLKNGGDMLPLFKHLKDPLVSYESKRKPAALPSDKKDDDLEKRHIQGKNKTVCFWHNVGHSQPRKGIWYHLGAVQFCTSI